MGAALRFAFFIGKLRREAGKPVPPSLLKLIHRIERPVSRKRTKVSSGEFTTMKAAFDDEEFRVEVATFYRYALAKGVKPDDWPAMCGFARAAFNSKYPAPDSAKDPLKKASEDLLQKLSPEGPEPNLADLVAHPEALFIARPKGWEEVYKFHIQLEEGKQAQKELKDESEKQQREIGRARKQKVKLEGEMQGSRANSKTLNSNPSWKLRRTENSRRNSESRNANTPRRPRSQQNSRLNLRKNARERQKPNNAPTKKTSNGTKSGLERTHLSGIWKSVCRSKLRSIEQALQRRSR